MIEFHRGIAIVISPVIVLIGIYSNLKAKKNYECHQKRTVITSTLCILYHNGFVAIVSYSAFFSTFPFFNESFYYEMHIFCFIMGVCTGLASIIIYIMYLFKIESVPRALGLNPDKLITDGIFQKTRNPQALARDIGLISLSVCGRSFYSLILAIVFIAINHNYILIEEEFLEKKFGDAYLEYCSLTPRYYGIFNNKK